MPRLTETDSLTDLQRDILGTVRDLVEAEIIPVAGRQKKMIIGRRLLERFTAG